MEAEQLTHEIASRRAYGCELVSVAEMTRRFRALGYVLDRSMDCRASARIMTGPDAGRSYPCCTTYVREADTGLSAANVQARRVENYRRMAELRQTVFAVSRGAILEP